MKVGDLVVLSAAGQKIDANWPHKGEMGVIIQINSTVENPYQIKWLGSSWSLTPYNRYAYWFKRYEIKKAKPIS